MKNIEIKIEDQLYKIIKHSDVPLTFRILHNSGMHHVGRKDDGTYVYLTHEPFANKINLEQIGIQIDKHLGV